MNGVRYAMISLLLILVVFCTGITKPILAQTDEQEIKRIIATAPVEEVLGDSYYVFTWYKALVDAGKSKEATQSAKKIKDEYRRAQDLSELSWILALANRKSAAVHVAHDALKAEQAVEDPIQKINDLSNITLALKMSGQDEEANKIVHQILQIQHYQYDEFTQASMASALAKVGCVKEAIQAAEHIRTRSNDITPVLRSIAVACLKSGTVHETVDAIKKVQSSWYRVWFFYGVADFLIKENRPAEALPVTQLACEAALACETGLKTPWEYALMQTIPLLAEADGVDEALTLAEKMERIDAKVYALSHIAAILAKGGKKVEASEVAHKAVDTTQNTSPRPDSQKGTFQNASVQKSVFTALAQADSEECFRAARLRLDPPEGKTLYIGGSPEGIAQVMIELGRSKESDEILVLALQKVKNNDSLVDIADALVRKDRLSEALTLFRQVEPSQVKTIFLGFAGKRLGREEKKEDAQRIMDLALEETLKIADPFEKATALGQFTLLLAESGNKEEVDAIARQTIKAAHTPDYYSKDAVLSQVAKAYALCGNYRLARETCAECKAQERLSVYTEILKHYASHKSN